MDAANVIVVVAGIVATAAVIAWFLLRRNEPEDAAGHGPPDRTGSSQFVGAVDDRPAGPGAEAQGVADRGEPTPGPSADDGPADGRQPPVA